MPTSQLHEANGSRAKARDASWGLPRLGGRRPFYTDAAFWCGTFAYLEFILIDTRWLAVYSGRLTFATCAGLVMSWWALWRFGRFSTGLADVAFRREIALSGVSARAFLTRQLFWDVIAAFGPFVITLLLVPHRVAGLVACSVIVTAAGASWVFSQRCKGTGHTAIAACTTITLAAASIGVAAADRMCRYYLDLPNSQLLLFVILTGLFLTSAQIGGRSSRAPAATSPRTDSAWLYLRLLLSAIVGSIAVLAAWRLFLAMPANSLFIPYHAIRADGRIDPLHADVFALPAALVMLAGLILCRRLHRHEAQALWPANTIAALAIAAGVVVFPAAQFPSGIVTLVPSHILQGLAIAMPVGGLALLATRSSVSTGTYGYLKVAAGQFLGTAIGVLFGLGVLGAAHDIPFIVPVVAAGLLFAIYCMSLRCGDPPLVVSPLVFAGLLLWVRSTPGLTLAFAAAAFVLIQWKRLERNYFGNL